MAARPAKPLSRGAKPDAEADLAKAGERRQVTALYYDLVGSTDLMQRLDLEDYQELIAAFHAIVNDAVTRHQGAIRDLHGDGGIALFVSPIDPKDTASLAIAAGLDTIEGCRKLAHSEKLANLHVRVGIATSMAIITTSEAGLAPEQVTGVAPALAARLQAIARPDTVAVSQLTRQLAGRSFSFRFLGRQELKGFAAENAWRALRHKLNIDRFFAFGRLTSRIVGREHELARAFDCWEKAVAGEGQVLLIEGEAGIGKSRLLHEIRKSTRATRKRLLLLQCAPGGAHETLHPLLHALSHTGHAGARKPSTARIEALFYRNGIDDREAVRVFAFLLGAEGRSDADLAGAAPDAIRDKAVAAAERCLAALAAEGPLLIAIEDAHWIDPTSSSILAALAGMVKRYPALLVVTARRFASDARPGNGGTSHIALSALDREATRLAIEQSWPQAAEALPAGLIEPIHQVTAGNPLFVEEFCQWMSENRSAAAEVLTRGSASTRPDAFENILSARLANLGPAQEIARYAAVLGRDVDYSLLCGILPDVNAESILEALRALGDAGIMLRNRIPGYPAFSFRHALIQETIYASLLRKTRQAVHGRVFRLVTENRDLAPWIGSAALADHAERSGMIEEAIAAFVAAGKESSAQSALAEARQMLEHALELIDQAAADRQEALKLAVISALGPVLIGIEGKKSPRAARFYAEGVALARHQGREDQPKLFPVYWGWWFTAPDFGDWLERTQVLIADLKHVDDAEVQLQMRHCAWAIDFNVGRHDTCIDAVDAGMAFYEEGRGAENFTLYGGHDAKVCGLGQRGLSLWMTGQGDRALASIRQSCAWAESTTHLGSIAHAYDIAAMFHRYRRDFSELRSVLARMRDLAEKHNLPALTAKTMIFEGWCLGATEDVQAGRELMEKGLAIQAEIDTPEDLPVYGDMLAELLGLAGDAEAGLRHVASAVAAVEDSGHRYWLAQLHHRRLRLLAQSGASAADKADAADASLRIALEQKAITLLISAYRTAEALGVPGEILARYRTEVEEAEKHVEAGSILFVNMEPLPHG
ncbi:MAG: AAA family ATPase [Parvibaculaceae bacterium]